jgi:hypothetical protein
MSKRINVTNATNNASGATAMSVTTNANAKAAKRNVLPDLATQQRLLLEAEIAKLKAENAALAATNETNANAPIRMAMNNPKSGIVLYPNGSRYPVNMLHSAALQIFTDANVKRIRDYLAANASLFTKRYSERD